MRSRQRKKNYQEILESQIDDQKIELEIVVQSKKDLEQSNRQLKQENEYLRQQLSNFQSSSNSNSTIHQQLQALEQYKLQMLNKLSPIDLTPSKKVEEETITDPAAHFLASNISHGQASYKRQRLNSGSILS